MVAFTHLTTGSSTSNQLVYSTASAAPAANQVIYAAVLATTGSGTPSLPTLTGWGLTWDLVRQAPSPTAIRTLFWFRAATGGTAPTPGTLTFTFTGTNLTGAMWSVYAAAGADMSGTNGSGATVQSIESRLSSQTSLNAAFTDPVGAGNGSLAVVGLLLATAITPGTGWSSPGGTTTYASPSQAFMGMHSNTAQQNVVASWSGTSNTWVIAVEVKAAAAGESHTTSATAAAIAAASGVTATSRTTTRTATAKAAGSAVSAQVDWFPSDVWVGAQAWGPHLSESHTTSATATARAAASAGTAAVRTGSATATARTAATATTAPAHPTSGSATARGSAAAATISARPVTGAATAKATASATTSHTEGAHITTGTAVAKATATFTTGTARVTTGTAAARAGISATTTAPRFTTATGTAKLGASASATTVRSSSGTGVARSVASAIIRTDRGGQAYAATALALASAVTVVGSPFRDITVTWGAAGISRALAASAGHSRALAASGASRTLTAVPEE